MNRREEMNKTSSLKTSESFKLLFIAFCISYQLQMTAEHEVAKKVQKHARWLSSSTQKSVKTFILCLNWNWIKNFHLPSNFFFMLCWELFPSHFFMIFFWLCVTRLFAISWSRDSLEARSKKINHIIQGGNSERLLKGNKKNEKLA